MEAGKITLESRDKGAIGQITIEEAIAKITAEISDRK
jgi:threonyl-tRNA synthetase